MLGAELLGSPSLFAASISKIVQSYALEVVVAEDVHREQFVQAED
jgi:hypothetical protein